MVQETGPNTTNENQRDTSKNNTEAKGQICKTPAEYFTALEKWLQEVYVMQGFMASFPYFMMYNQMMPSVPRGGHTQTNNFTSGIHTAGYVIPNQFPQSLRVGEALRHRVIHPVQTQPRQQDDAQEGIEYKIPAVWKRIIAEFLDFVILLFVRLAITFIAVDFDIIDLEKYDFDLLSKNVKMEYKLAMEMTSEILFLELIHRLVVCLFEAFWIRRGVGPRVGGATPGKALLGIRVVLCERITPIAGRPPDVVLVYPGTDPGLFWAFSRSLIKNLILAVLFPVCFVLFLFRHNRTGYDIVCRTLVVEDPPPNNN